MLEVGYLVSYANRVASNRYRVAVPVREMRRLGVNAGVGNGLITIVEKSVTDHRERLESIKKKGHKVLIDFCDLHTDVGHFMHEGWVDLADGIVCNTPALEVEVRARNPNFKGQFFIIEDPYEFPETPVDMPGKGERLFWFGHVSNYPPLRDLLQSRQLMGTLHQLTAASDPRNPANKFWPVNQTWTVAKTIDGLAWADMVLIPSRTADIQKEWPLAHCKGANRLVEAVRRGRYAINDGVVDAYRDYGMWCGDIPEGIEWVRRNPEEALDQVRNAQSIVRAKNDPVYIAKQWLAACNAVGGKLWHWTEPMTG